VKPDIVVRDIRFELSDAIPRYWFDGDPAKTHFMNALSTTFPDGEAFFVRAVMHYRDRIGSSELKAQIARFAGQEGTHAREHSAHVDLLVRQGYGGIAWLNAEADRQGRWANRTLPLLSLASTAALEHLTAIMANRALRDPAYWREPMHPDIAPLWQWHAIEEAEHKAVAFDVLQQVSSSYGLRALALVLAAASLWADNLVRFGYFAWKDGLFFRPKIWLDMLRFVWGRDGLYGSLWRDFFAWFRPGFHPWQQDNRALIEARLDELRSCFPASLAGA
jgi:predicted metal-dependent hydrolase